MSISNQDANALGFIAWSAAASWVVENLFQIIPAAVAVISLIFLIKRHYQDKKKRDLEMELIRLQIGEHKNAE